MKSMEDNWFLFLIKDKYTLTVKEAKRAMLFFAVITVLVTIFCIWTFTTAVGPETSSEVVRYKKFFIRLLGVTAVIQSVLADMQIFLIYLKAKEHEAD